MTEQKPTPDQLIKGSLQWLIDNAYRLAATEQQVRLVDSHVHNVKVIFNLEFKASEKPEPKPEPVIEKEPDKEITE